MTRITQRTLFLALALFAGSCAHVSARGWSVGVGVLVGNSEYRDTDVRVMPFPFVRYEGERLHLDGLGGGVHVFKDGGHKISANVYYDAQSFDGSDSDDARMKRLDDRDSTVMAGLSYSFASPRYGIFRVGASGDILGEHDGFRIDAGYTYGFRLGGFFLMPGAGAIFSSGNYNDYYYGIGADESAASGLPEYKAGTGVSPYAQLLVHYKIADNWNAFFLTRLTLMNDEVKDSPMVDGEVKFSFGVGASYSF